MLWQRSREENPSQGVMLTHSNVMHCIATQDAMVVQAEGVDPPSEDDVYLSWLPLAHIMVRTTLPANSSFLPAFILYCIIFKYYLFKYLYFVFYLIFFHMCSGAESGPCLEFNSRLLLAISLLPVSDEKMHFLRKSPSAAAVHGLAVDFAFQGANCKSLREY